MNKYFINYFGVFFTALFLFLHSATSVLAVCSSNTYYALNDYPINTNSINVTHTGVYTTYQAWTNSVCGVSSLVTSNPWLRTSGQYLELGFSQPITGSLKVKVTATNAGERFRVTTSSGTPTLGVVAGCLSVSGNDIVGPASSFTNGEIEIALNGPTTRVRITDVDNENSGSLFSFAYCIDGGSECGDADGASYYTSTPTAPQLAGQGDLCTNNDSQTSGPNQSGPNRSWDCPNENNCSATNQYCGDGLVNGTEQCENASHCGDGFSCTSSCACVCIDTDNDGVCDNDDVCDTDPYATTTGGPTTLGDICTQTSAANACGDTNTTSGTILCDSSCDAATPTVPTPTDTDNDGVPDCNDVCDADPYATTTGGPTTLGDICTQTSAANACGDTNTTSGTILCDSSCDAATPTVPTPTDTDNDGVPDCNDVCDTDPYATTTGGPTTLGDICTQTSAANACGDTNTTSGTILCDSSCDAATPTVPTPTDTDNDGVPDCNDVCDADPYATTTGGPTTLGDICTQTSAANACGDTNTTSGTILCDSSCDAATPTVPTPTDTDNDGVPDCNDVCPANARSNTSGAPLNYQNACAQTSMPNTCGETSTITGNIACDGICDSGIPSTPIASDVDGDGIPDCDDNCQDIANTNQVDTNGNGLGDACDLEHCRDDGPLNDISQNLYITSFDQSAISGISNQPLSDLTICFEDTTGTRDIFYTTTDVNGSFSFTPNLSPYMGSRVNVGIMLHDQNGLDIDHHSLIIDK